MAELITRVPPVDVLERDAEALVLTESLCVRISIVALVLYEHLELPRSLEELSTALEAQFGPAPGGTREAVEQMVGELQNIGLVER